MRKFSSDVRKDVQVKQAPQENPGVRLFVPVAPAKYPKVMRPGKTAKDHRSGAHKRRLENQLKRAATK